MTCNEAYALIVRTIDDARLSGEKRAALRRHLLSCECCRAEYETQHEVRRLLVLHIQDRDQLPAGFAERLSARLARTSRPPAAPTAAPSMNPRWLQGDAEHVTRRDVRARTWILRLFPIAATLALIVTGASVREGASPSSVSSDSPDGISSDAAAGQPRASTTIVLPRDEGAPRRRRLPPVLAERVALAPAPAQPKPRPLVDDGDRYGTETVAESGARVEVEHASKGAKEAPGTSVVGDRVAASERRGQDRERVESEERDGDGEAGGERAASQRPGILPRPAIPFPQARPAMPAPPPVLPDRSIPPW
jgi:hypothetical protein